MTVLMTTENENTFEAENPWVEIALDSLLLVDNKGDFEIYYRPEGKEIAKIRRVK